MKLNIVKRTVMATALAVATAAAVAGMPSNALALGFNFGDLGFFVYGGNDQRYENLGPGSALPTLEGSSLTTLDISSSLTSLSNGAVNGLRYSIMGVGAGGANYYVSSTSATITAGQANNSSAAGAAGVFDFWAGQHAAQTGGVSNPYANNPATTAAAAPHSFTSVLGTDGSIQGNLGFTTHGTLGQLLNIFRVNVDGVNPETYTRVATALLSANGQLMITPAAVPIPAAVYLFGTGLVALVGIARRSFNKKAA